MFCTATAAPLFLSGCNGNPAGNQPPVAAVEKPILASASAPTSVLGSVPTTAPSTQPVDVVAELSTMKITRGDLDAVLYKAYGLQMVFDLVELQLAKNTLLGKQNKVLEPADIDRERDLVLSNMFPDAAKADYPGLFNQFLQKEKIKREEFEIRAIETSAVLRKIIEPMVVGNISEQALHRGYDILYGANREVADIVLANQRDATTARNRCVVDKEPFEKVAREMSIDADTRESGGIRAPFSARTNIVPQVIVEAAFSMEVGQISDPLLDGTNYHIIKVLGVIEPKAARFEDVKDAVKKQMETQLIEKNMKDLRQKLQLAAQQQIKFDDPVLKAQWDEILARQQPTSTDKNAVEQQMNQHVGPVKH